MFPYNNYIMLTSWRENSIYFILLGIFTHTILIVKTHNWPWHSFLPSPIEFSFFVRVYFATRMRTNFPFFFFFVKWISFYIMYAFMLRIDFPPKWKVAHSLAVLLLFYSFTPSRRCCTIRSRLSNVFMYSRK